jgi:hypothetical protein
MEIQLPRNCFDPENPRTHKSQAPSFSPTNSAITEILTDAHYRKSKNEELRSSLHSVQYFPEMNKPMHNELEGELGALEVIFLLVPLPAFPWITRDDTSFCNLLFFFSSQNKKAA